MIVSFCAVLLPLDVLDEIFDLTESVSEGFPTYSFRLNRIVEGYTVLSGNDFERHADTIFRPWSEVIKILNTHKYKNINKFGPF